MQEHAIQKPCFNNLSSLPIILIFGSLPGCLFVLSAADYTRNKVDRMMPGLGRLGGAIIGDKLEAGAVIGLITDFLGFILLPFIACCVTQKPTLKPSLLLATVFYGWFVLGACLQTEGYNVLAAALMAPFYIGFSMTFCLPVFLVRKQIGQERLS